MSDAPARPKPIPARLAHPGDRAIGVAGLTLWCIAAAIIAADARGAARDPTAFVFTECWLIGAGCLGAPVAFMRILGRALTSTTCRTVSAANFGAAAALTAGIFNGWRLTMPVATASLVMLLAAGIQATNAACVQSKLAAARTEGFAAGHDEGYREAMAAVVAEQRKRLAAIAAKEEALMEDTQEIPAADRRNGHTILRALPSPPPDPSSLRRLHGRRHSGLRG